MHKGMGRLEVGRAVPDAEQADSLRHGTVLHLVSLKAQLLPTKLTKTTVSILNAVASDQARLAGPELSQRAKA